MNDRWIFLKLNSNRSHPKFTFLVGGKETVLGDCCLVGSREKISLNLRSKINCDLTDEES